MGNEIIGLLYKIIKNLCFVFCFIFRENNDLYKESGTVYESIFTWEITEEWLFTFKLSGGFYLKTILIFNESPECFPQSLEESFCG